MTEMPNRNYLTSGATTEAQFQSGIGDLYDVINQLAILGTSEEIQILTNSITPSKTDIIIDTENLASTDTLDFILPNNVGEKLIFLRIKQSSRQITLNHMSSGTGKIELNGGANVTLKSPSQTIALKWEASTGKWRELWRNFGIVITSGEEASIRSQLGLGTAATRDTGLLTGQIPLRENFGSAAFVNTGTSTGQVPLANQLGSLAFKSIVTDSEMNGSGVTPGTYDSVVVNAQGRVTAGSAPISVAPGNYDTVTVDSQGRVTSGVLSSNRPGIAKAWVTFNPNTNAIYASHNVASVTGTGSNSTKTINFSSPFSNTNYCVLVSAEFSGLSSNRIATTSYSNRALSSVNVLASVGDFVSVGNSMTVVIYAI